MKNWSGKFIGMLIGFMLGHLPGLVVGFLIGHLFDQGYFKNILRGPSIRGQTRSIPHIFFNTTFQVMGHLAKADGRVSEQEIAKARQIMHHMHLDPHMTKEAIGLFTEGKKPNFNLSQALWKLKNTCLFQPALLGIFIEIQIQMAYAEGDVPSFAKHQILQQIRAQLGISKEHFEQIERRFRTSHYQRGSSRIDPSHKLNQAYQLLGVPKTATLPEVKKAYRRLMNQHHPDKLIAKGLPPEMIKLATQKTQQIKTAYEQIEKFWQTQK